MAIQVKIKGNNLRTSTRWVEGRESRIAKKGPTMGGKHEPSEKHARNNQETQKSNRSLAPITTQGGGGQGERLRKCEKRGLLLKEK